MDVFVLVWLVLDPVRGCKFECVCALSFRLAQMGLQIRVYLELAEVFDFLRCLGANDGGLFCLPLCGRGLPFKSVNVRGSFCESREVVRLPKERG